MSLEGARSGYKNCLECGYAEVSGGECHLPDKPTIKDSGQRTEFHTGAVRDMHTGKGRFDLLPPEGITRIARIYEAGCIKYGDRNWEKGIPINSFIDSGLRHLFKYMQGMKDEDHLAQAGWNILCALTMEDRLGYLFERSREREG